jgi:hypothetical protein
VSAPAGRAAAPIAHGYTLDDVEKVGAMAAARTRHLTMAPADRYELAVQTAGMVICTADERPPFGHLVHLAIRACQNAVRDELAAHGRNRFDGSPSPAFHRYWDGLRADPWDEVVVEHLALAQIWRQLPDRHRAVLAALAVFGQFEPAAASLGVTNGAFRIQLMRARRAFWALWHEGETPPARHWHSDRPARRGLPPGTRPARGAA